MGYTFTLDQIKEAAKNRPSGYIEDVLSNSIMYENNVVLTNDQYLYLKNKYSTHIETKKNTGGPGTELSALLSDWIGIKSKPGCKCKARANEMDSRGCDWCENNIDTIIGWLKEEHSKQKILLPFSEIIAKQLIKIAIYRARKYNSKNNSGDNKIFQSGTENSAGGIVTGNAIFKNSSKNYGTVDGNAIFEPGSCNSGTVTGTITGSPPSC